VINYDNDAFVVAAMNELAAQTTTTLVAEMTTKPKLGI
jgi:hypothetical protein